MNFSLQCKTFIFALCAITAQMYSMESSIVVAEKPTIEGNIFIIRQKTYDTQVHYAAKYHNTLNQMGIPSSPEIPLVPVKVIGFDSSRKTYKDWTFACCVPYPITEFEIEQSKVNGCLDNDQKVTKSLPNLLPATCLFGKKTGDKVFFNFYGYPVQLTCSSARSVNRPFDDLYNRSLELFVNNATYDIMDYEECSKLGLIKRVGAKVTHGENGFVSMEKLMVDLVNKQESAKKAHLLLCFKNSLIDFS